MPIKIKLAYHLLPSPKVPATWGINFMHVVLDHHAFQKFKANAAEGYSTDSPSTESAVEPPREPSARDLLDEGRSLRPLLLFSFFFHLHHLPKKK